VDLPCVNFDGDGAAELPEVRGNQVEGRRRNKHRTIQDTFPHAMEPISFASRCGTLLLFLASGVPLHASEPASLSVAAVLCDETALAGAHDIEIRDGLTYIAGKGFTSRALPRNGVYPYEKSKGGSLAIVDVKQPAALRLLWSARDPLAYEDAETVLPLGGHRLLVGSRELLLFDVAQPARPGLLANLEDRPQVDIINGFARLGDVVFGANKQGYIFAADVSVADELKLLGARNAAELDGLEKPHDVASSGDLLVVVSPQGFGGKGNPGRVGVYHVTDPATRRVLPPERWTIAGQIEDQRLAGANRVMTRGAFAYIGCSLMPVAGRTDGLRSGVVVMDLSDPTKPRLRGGIDFPDPQAQGPNGLEVAGTVVFAAGGQTVQAIEVSNPDAPRELARLSAPAAFPGGKDDAHDLVYHNGHLFVTAQNSHALVVIRVDNPQRREGAKTN
jgi:hypothetical protein